MTVRSCPACADGSCYGGHVYVLEVRASDGSLTHIVDKTSETVERRYQDYFDENVRPPISRFVRDAGRRDVRVAVEMFADRNPVTGDTSALEDAAGRLAEDLYARGMKVRLPMLGKRPR